MIDESFLKVVNNKSTDFYIHHTVLQRFDTSMHVHEKAQLLYAEGGVVHVFTEDRHWYLPSRCYMWIPANTAHSIVSYSKNVALYNFYFKVEPNEHPFYQTINIYFVDDMLREMFLFAKRWHGIALTEDNAAYRFLIAIKAILPDFHANLIPFSVQHPFPKDEKLIEIAQFLLQHIDQNYTIAEIAQLHGISVRTLTRKFKEQMGMNYVRFLRSLRISKALELMAENKYNMLEIALLVGYSSLPTFSNIFAKVTGMRPSDFSKILTK